MANIAIAAPAIIPPTLPRSTIALTGWAVVDVDMKGPFRWVRPPWTNRTGTHRPCSPFHRNAFENQMEGSDR
jgi:hypothetical protein